MKSLSLVLFAASALSIASPFASSTFAAEPTSSEPHLIDCKYQRSYRVSGLLKGAAMTVESFYTIEGNGTLDRNPISPKRAADGRLKYTLDALSADGKNGEICTLYIADKIVKGSAKSEYACSVYENGPSKHIDVIGTCTLQ